MSGEETVAKAVIVGLLLVSGGWHVALVVVAVLAIERLVAYGGR